MKWAIAHLPPPPWLRHCADVILNFAQHLIQTQFQSELRTHYVPDFKETML